MPLNYCDLEICTNNLNLITMKKSLLILTAALVATFAAQAQIPNSGFESWDARTAMKILRAGPL
jgi:hypothetical protein